MAKLDVNKQVYEEKRALSRMYQKKLIERRERQVQHINRQIFNESKQIGRKRNNCSVDTRQHD